MAALALANAPSPWPPQLARQLASLLLLELRLVFEPIVEFLAGKEAACSYLEL
ncbi:hypothetical protein SBBP1_160002 [Burkholderiales bacterium]|nr:hypothetical protein SBBP1_160002 [Burkholderiales bacterium]